MKEFTSEEIESAIDNLKTLMTGGILCDDSGRLSYVEMVFLNDKEEPVGCQLEGFVGLKKHEEPLSERETFMQQRIESLVKQISMLDGASRLIIEDQKRIITELKETEENKPAVFEPIYQMFGGEFRKKLTSEEESEIVKYYLDHKAFNLVNTQLSLIFAVSPLVVSDILSSHGVKNKKSRKRGSHEEEE